LADRGYLTVNVSARGRDTPTWKLSTDPLFIDKVHDVAGLYLDPPDNALVLCVDDKSQVPGPGPDRSVPADPAHDPGAE
jgi:hypothetical protein